VGRKESDTVGGTVHIPFAASPRSSLGIEWELGLVDLQTRQLRSGASAILADLVDKVGEEGAAKAKHELFESAIEIITGVCDTVEEATADLAGTLAILRDLAERRGMGLMCAGTHPFTDYRTQEVSQNPRYLRLVEAMQWPARRFLIFGVHVHVGVRSAEKVIPMVNALTAYVPHFLALSASSPYWLGMDTGLASARSKVFELLPTAGLPQHFGDWNEFEVFMEALTRAGTIETVREVWWDIRPHPDFGTVELRMCDGLPTLAEVGAVAALAQCLVEWMDARLDGGHKLPSPPRWVAQENKWRAARYGLDAQIILDAHGTTRGVREDVYDLVDELAPVAGRLGCTTELAYVRRICASGASHARQLVAAHRAGGDLEAVVDTLLEEMNAGRPLVDG
jgi:carboxylate-amine ligase